MKAKLILFIISCIATVSCSDVRRERMLKELDDLVENRLEIYSAYEAGLQELKDSLNLVVSLEDKWALADRLYDSYAYFNLDSAVTYLGLQKKYAHSLRQEYLTALNEVQVMAYRHNEATAESIFLSLDTVQVQRLRLRREYYYGGIVLYSNNISQQYHQPHCFVLSFKTLLKPSHRDGMRSPMP